MATLTKNNNIYNAYYGDFRGVDFSNDHTQVSEQRLAYAVNMYKDYQSGQGKALETIPGFRRRVVLPEETEIYGIHQFKHRDANGDIQTKILIHSGSKLYLWHNYPNTIGVTMEKTVMIPESSGTSDIGIPVFNISLDKNVAKVLALETHRGDKIFSYSYTPSTQQLAIQSNDITAGENLNISFVEGEIQNALFSDMNMHRSLSFIMNNHLYLIDGKNYLVYDGKTVKRVTDAAYIPTTYINVVPSGENADIGKEYEQRNILQPKFKHTFIADGTTTEFYMNENALEEISEVKVYGDIVDNYEVDLQDGKITFSEAPHKPEDVEGGYFPELYAGIEITAKKTLSKVSGVIDECADTIKLITDCTIATVFDNRVFLSGNPACPNHVFYCARNTTGYVDPTYFGILNYMQDGVGISPITGMIPVADTLMVLKGDAQQDGSTYFHTPVETGTNIQPKIYPATQGLSGIGCLGACINFLDDPVFISRLGVEAVGQLSVRYERAIEHRSSLIDAKLVNMELKNASLEEWNGYLILLVDGKIFMADSRQRYTHESGVIQYEWYYLEDIGIFKDQYLEYRYASRLFLSEDEIKVHYCTKCRKSVKQCTCGESNYHIEIPLSLADSVFSYYMRETNDLTGDIANAPKEDGTASSEIFDEFVTVELNGMPYDIGVNYTIYEVYDEFTGELKGFKAYFCEGKGNYTGGIFKKACIVKTLDNNLFFGTENGIVCSFNFDTRNEMGEIPLQFYSFDERTIHCGCATKMDCCGIPHLTKNTVKKSTVVKTKSLPSSAAKIKVRTNKKPYNQIARINSSSFSFENVDFSDFSFITTEQSLFSVKEKEKKWVEKQYYVYSDEYLKPFALYYISFRYVLAGRFKE